jgi:hypothetical protein
VRTRPGQSIYVHHARRWRSRIPASSRFVHRRPLARLSSWLSGGLRAERGRLLEEGVGLGERRCRFEPLEDLMGLTKDGRSLCRSGEPDQAPALTEERERSLGNEPKPLPAIGGIGVGIGRGLQVTAGLGEGGVRRDETVLGDGESASTPSTRRSASCRSPIPRAVRTISGSEAA